MKWVLAQTPAPFVLFSRPFAPFCGEIMWHFQPLPFCPDFHWGFTTGYKDEMWWLFGLFLPAPLRVPSQTKSPPWKRKWWKGKWVCNPPLPPIWWVLSALWSNWDGSYFWICIDILFSGLNFNLIGPQRVCGTCSTCCLRIVVVRN